MKAVIDGGFICRFGLYVCAWGFEMKDWTIWQRGGERLSCRSEMRMWRGCGR